MRRILFLVLLFLASLATTKATDDILSLYQADLNSFLSKDASDTSRREFREQWQKKLEAALLSDRISPLQRDRILEVLVGICTSDGAFDVARKYNGRLLDSTALGKESLYWRINYCELGILQVQQHVGKPTYQPILIDVLADYAKTAATIAELKDFSGVQTRVPSFFQSYIQLLLADSKPREAGLVANEVLALYSQGKLGNQDTLVSVIDFQIFALRAALEQGDFGDGAELVSKLIKWLEENGMKNSRYYGILQGALGEFFLQSSKVPENESAVRFIRGIVSKKEFFNGLSVETRLSAAQVLINSGQAVEALDILLKLSGEVGDDNIMKGVALKKIYDIFETLGREQERALIRKELVNKFPSLINTK